MTRSSSTTTGGKRIAILGSTGSIGCNALEVVERLGPPYRVAALSAHSQTDKLLDQVRRHRPAAVALTADIPNDGVCRQLRELGAEVYRGPAGMAEMVRRDDIDLVLAAVVGAAGMPAVLAAVQT